MADPKNAILECVVGYRTNTIDAYTLNTKNPADVLNIKPILQDSLSILLQAIHSKKVPDILSKEDDAELIACIECVLKNVTIDNSDYVVEWITRILTYPDLMDNEVIECEMKNNCPLEVDEGLKKNPFIKGESSPGSPLTNELV
jgi:hypothetical protein